MVQTTVVLNRDKNFFNQIEIEIEIRDEDYQECVSDERTYVRIERCLDA